MGYTRPHQSSSSLQRLNFQRRLKPTVHERDSDSSHPHAGRTVAQKWSSPAFPVLTIQGHSAQPFPGTCTHAYTRRDHTKFLTTPAFGRPSNQAVSPDHQHSITSEWKDLPRRVTPRARSRAPVRSTKHQRIEADKELGEGGSGPKGRSTAKDGGNMRDWFVVRKQSIRGGGGGCGRSRGQRGRQKDPPAAGRVYDGQVGDRCKRQRRI